MASYFLYRYNPNQHGSPAVSNDLVVPDRDSGVNGIPSDYYTVDNYAAAVLAGFLVSVTYLNDSQVALV